MGKAPKFDIFINFYTIGLGIAYDGFSSWMIQILFFVLYFDHKGEGFSLTVSLGPKKLYPKPAKENEEMLVLE